MTDSSPQQNKPQPTFKTGDMLARRYRLIKRLGVGGYSTVFSALDLSNNREIAIKILKTGGGNNDPSALARLRQEANLLQSISHPHVLTIYAFEQFQDLAYVTMENVPGISLAHIIYREGPAPSERVLPIAKQLLGALHAVHAQNILHRDIKPENILITPGQPETCKIVDFGLAKAYIDTNLGADKLKVTLVKTKAGGFLGTPRYTPPEQALGDDVGPYTDLFSLGLVIAEWLTGEVRLKGDTHAELMRNLVGPKAIDVSDCPRAWQKWLAMILCKDPNRRFRSAQQALTALINEVESEVFDRRAEELALDVPDGFFSSTESDNNTSFLDEDGPLELDLERVQNTPKPSFAPPNGPPLHHNFGPPPQFGQSPQFGQPPQQGFSNTPLPFQQPHHAVDEIRPAKTSLSTYVLVAIIGGSIGVVILIVILLIFQ